MSDTTIYEVARIFQQASICDDISRDGVTLLLLCSSECAKRLSIGASRGNAEIITEEAEESRIQKMPATPSKAATKGVVVYTITQEPEQVSFTLTYTGQSEPSTCRLWFKPEDCDLMLRHVSGPAFSAVDANDPEFETQHLSVGGWILECGDCSIWFRLLDKPEATISSPGRIDQVGYLANFGDCQKYKYPASGAIEGYEIEMIKQFAVSRTQVFLAHDGKLNKQVVVKKIHSTPMNLEGSRDPEPCEEWSRQSSILKDLNHERIVTLLDCDGRFLALHFEYVDARNLAEQQDEDFRTTLSVGSATRILTEISGALEYLHAKSIEHRAVIPNNILFSEERGAVLCGFGSAVSAYSKSTKLNVLPIYLPLDCLPLSEKRGEAADLYALGVTALFIKGRIKHPESAYFHRIRKQESPVSIMADWVDDLRDGISRLDVEDPSSVLIKSMLNPNPSERISAGQAVAMFKDLEQPTCQNLVETSLERQGENRLRNKKSQHKHRRIKTKTSLQTRRKPRQLLHQSG